MATLEQAIQTAAAAVFAGKLYQDEAPEDPPAEYCVWERAGGQDFVMLNNRSGMTQNRIQFTIVARRSARVAELATALRAAMKDAATATVPAALQNTPLGPGFSLPPDMTTAKARVVEFSVWFDESP